MDHPHCDKRRSSLNDINLQRLSCFNKCPLHTIIDTTSTTTIIIANTVDNAIRNCSCNAATIGSTYSFSNDDVRTVVAGRRIRYNFGRSENVDDNNDGRSIFSVDDNNRAEPVRSEVSKELSTVSGDTLREPNDDYDRMWIFGYGSICWNPGFLYEKSLTGYIEGFSRKFWQGSITHRGTVRNPGRVVTLIEEEDKKAIVWGRVFQVRKDRKEVLDYLQHRECSSGGYVPTTLVVRLKDHLDYGLSDDSVEAVTFVALSDNYLWLGNASLVDICSQIVSCKGHAGHNIEYLLRLTDYMRRHIPQETDSELFALETLVVRYVKENRLSLNEIIGNDYELSSNIDHVAFDIMRQVTTDEQQQSSPHSSINSSFVTSTASSSSSAAEFASRIPDKKLRCLDI